VDDDGVAEGALRQDVLHLHPAVEQVHHHVSRVAGIVQHVTLGGRGERRGGRRHSQGFRHHLHGRRGAHELARAVARQRMVLDEFEFLRGQ